MQRIFSILALILSLPHLSQSAYIESFANRGKYLVAKDPATLFAQTIRTANVNADFAFDLSRFHNYSYVGCTNSSLPRQRSFGKVPIEIGKNGKGHIGTAKYFCAFNATSEGLAYFSIDEKGNCFGADSLPADILSRAKEFGEVCGAGMDKRIVFNLGYSTYSSSLNLVENDIVKKLRLKQNGKAMNLGDLIIKRADPKSTTSTVTNILLQSKADPTLFAMVENNQVFLRKFENTPLFRTKATFLVSDQLGSSKIQVKLVSDPRGASGAMATSFKPITYSSAPPSKPW